MLTFMKRTAKAFESQGKYVAFGLIILTAIVGSLFIYLGPKATEKTPGILHVGIRYANENTIAFTRYSKTGPGARIEFIAPDGDVADSVDNLKIGRNLVPIGALNDGPYRARLSAPDFLSVEIPVIVQGRMLNPPTAATFPEGCHADFNMIGVRFQPQP